ncbi:MULTISPECIES: DNA-deoxyinosine glycosylase [Stenotrophomonas]|uniref:DNA-deoxyinosine glycosylase n=1 Tax=Stenotrophomonas TaxID=40323 RepID=UPI0009EA728C|nr:MULTISPECIES: DNA-deoxyinosine glycosylase [Stenotrophomonas]
MCPGKDIHGVVSRVTNETMLQGLPAQVNERCRVLVLGSMPGMASLQAARYYAHPRNRFWPLMGALCGFDPQREYAARLACLQQAGVGLWDVIGRCRRRGSLDAAIVRGSEVANPLPELVQGLPRLRAIACNGAAAAQAFERHVHPALPPGHGLTLLALPSTSPANAAWSFERLLGEWTRLSPWLPVAEHSVP